MMLASAGTLSLPRVFLLASLLIFALTGLAHASEGPGSASSSPGVRKPKRQLPVMTVERLKDFDGKNESLPLLVGIDRRVYDVSTKRDVSVLTAILNIPISSTEVLTRSLGDTGLWTRRRIRNVCGKGQHQKFCPLLDRSERRRLVHRRSRREGLQDAG